MKEILEIINQIASTNSRNDKERILQDNKDNQLLKDVLKFVFDPFVLTGISDKKIKKNVKIEGYIKLGLIEDIYGLISYLKLNNTGSDDNIATVQYYISNQPEALQDFIKQIVTKSLKIGATESTLNKVFGKGFIPSFGCMLAEKYFEHEAKVSGDFIITEKLDGVRNLLIKENGTIKMFSRQGQPHEGFVEIEEDAKNLPDNMVYDGEFILINEKGLNSADLYRETVKVARKDGIKKNIIFHVFDALPVEDFKNGICNVPCVVRKARLFQYDFNFIKIVPALYGGSNKDVIPQLLDKVIAEGKEGLMLNIADAPYECKRTRSILKIKRMQSADLRVVGFEEGSGKYVGKLGRMNVEYKGFTVGVGSGFTDADREYIWNNQSEYLGKIVEIQYFEESSNQNGGISLRFPVFKCTRFEKSEPSYF